MNEFPPHNAASTKEFIVMMAACMSIVAISIDAMLPALGIIGEDLGATHPNQAQLIISGIFAGMATGQLICGPLSDALGRKRLLFLALIVYLAGTCLCLVADSITAIMVGRFIQGLGVAGPYVSTMSIVRDRYSGNAMARIMSLVMMIFIMVPVIAPSLGQIVLYLATWRYIFVLFLVYASGIMIWAALRLEETLPSERRVPFSLSNIFASAKQVLSNRATSFYMLCAGCVFGCLLGYLNSCLQIFQELFDVGDQFVFYFGGLALTLGVSSLCNSRLVVRYGMRAICFRALLAMVTISALMLLSQLFTSPVLWHFVLFAALQFFCLGLIFGNLNALAMEPMGHIAGTASAIIGAVSSVVSIFAGTLIGQMYNHTLFPLLVGYLTLGFLAILLFYSASSPEKYLESTTSA